MSANTQTRDTWAADHGSSAQERNTADVPMTVEVRGPRRKSIRAATMEASTHMR